MFETMNPRTSIFELLVAIAILLLIAVFILGSVSQSNVFDSGKEIDEKIEKRMETYNKVTVSQK